MVNQQAMFELLRKLGVKCDIVGNGEDAVRAAITGKYDLVLMDKEMPKLDGIQAAIQIRQYEEINGGHVPIVALTGTVSLDDRTQCLNAGMDEFLTKPVRMRELNDLMKKMTSKRKL